MENKLGISDEHELARQEELITKKRALELFEKGLVDDFEVGTFQALSRIHAYLFGDVYNFGVKFQKVCPLGLFTACISWACGTRSSRFPIRILQARRRPSSLALTQQRTGRRLRCRSA